MMESDGSNTKQLTVNAGLINQAPCVTADGRYIVFLSDRSKYPQIWRIDIDGNNAKKLTNIPLDPLWSSSLECTPDGKWVLFPKSEPEWGISAKPSRKTGRCLPIPIKICREGMSSRSCR